MEQKCLFCAIISKQIPAKVVYEDETSIAVLDIAPRSKGMSLVIPKRHYRDFSEDLELSIRIFTSALIVAEKIKQALQPKDIEFSIIPSEQLNHFHIRVYPVYEDEIPLVETPPKQVTEKELDDISSKIKSVNISIVKKEEVKEEPKPVEESKRSEEDIFWIKRATKLT
jgi:histidine triad (HIT) family protein